MSELSEEKIIKRLKDTISLFNGDTHCFTYSDNERVEAFCELQTILSMIDKLELKEAYRMGAKDSYIYMQSMDMLKI